jgi:hypothetical protein
MERFRPKESPFWRESSFLDESEMLSELVEKKGTSLFLGRYSLDEVRAVLVKKNFFKEARKRKLWPLSFDLDSSEFPVQRFQIFWQKNKPKNVVVDLKIKEGVFHPKKEYSSGLPLSEYRFLILEWLTLQNPLMSFSGDRSPLPGQKHPGLNLGKRVLDIFIYLARITKKDGLLAFPAYFHNALLFSRYFHFLNPEKKGEVLSIKKAFPEVPFKKLAWIVYLGCLREKKGGIYEWKAEEMVYPLNKGLKSYFGSRPYKQRAKKSQRSFQFEIDWECYKKQEKREELNS